MIKQSAATDLLLEKTKRSHALWVSRCATAIYVILKTITKSNSLVVVPGNICLSVIAAIKFSENTPYLVDINLESQSILPESLAKIPRNANVVIIYPYMYGICHPDAEIISDICRKRGWIFIEDCAQALGGSVNGMMAGYLGDVSVFSFGAGKIVDCGCGGAIVTNHSEMIHEFSKVYSGLPKANNDHIKNEEAYGHIFKSLYSAGERWDNIDLWRFYAAQLETFRDIFVYQENDLPFNKIHEGLLGLEKNLSQRNDHAAQFIEIFSKVKIDYMSHPKGSTYWRFSIFVPSRKLRNEILNILHKNNLHASSWYPTIDRYFRERKTDQEIMFRNCDSVEKKIINLWVNDSIGIEYIQESSQLIIAHCLNYFK